MNHFLSSDWEKKKKASGLRLKQQRLLLGVRRFYWDQLMQLSEEGSLCTLGRIIWLAIKWGESLLLEPFPTGSLRQGPLSVSGSWRTQTRAGMVENKLPMSTRNVGNVVSIRMIKDFWSKYKYWNVFLYISHWYFFLNINKQFWYKYLRFYPGQ